MLDLLYTGSVIPDVEAACIGALSNLQHASTMLQ